MEWILDFEVYSYEYFEVKIQIASNWDGAVAKRSTPALRVGGLIPARNKQI